MACRQSTNRRGHSESQEAILGLLESNPLHGDSPTDIVHSASSPIDAVVGQRVSNDGDQWPQIRETGPKSVKFGDMRAMKLSRTSGPKSLARIM